MVAPAIPIGYAIAEAAVAAVPYVVAGLAAIGIGWGISEGISHMSSGDDAADNASEKAGSKTIAGTCTTGKCDPECPILSQQIENQAQFVQRRLEVMVIDQHDLYNTARTLVDNWKRFLGRASAALY